MMANQYSVHQYLKLIHGSVINLGIPLGVDDEIDFIGIPMTQVTYGELATSTYFVSNGSWGTNITFIGIPHNTPTRDSKWVVTFRSREFGSNWWLKTTNATIGTEYRIIANRNHRYVNGINVDEVNGGFNSDASSIFPVILGSYNCTESIYAFKSLKLTISGIVHEFEFRKMKGISYLYDKATSTYHAQTNNIGSIECVDSL